MSEPLVVGWKEYVDLPDLGLQRLKAKVDTGARTSAIHVADFEVDDGVVRMTLLRHRSDETVGAEAPLVGWLDVRNSGGELQPRPVVRTTIRLGQREAVLPVTLADRGGMLFRMLLGRKTLEELGAVVDVGRKYMLGRKRRR